MVKKIDYRSIQLALEGIDVAVTHGLKELVPETIGKVIDLGIRPIDLGIRPIDLTTIYDIARQFTKYQREIN